MRVISTSNFGYPHLTLKEGPKVKSDHTSRFPDHNKRVIDTFKFCYPRLTLNKGPKVKSENTKKFPADEFLYVGLPSQTF